MIKFFLIRHSLGIVFAIIAGIICIAPQLLLINAAGSDYQGIPFFDINDETYYMARMHDILDGHGWVSSPFIYEYKTQVPLMYPLVEYLYAIPAFIFGIGLQNIIVFGRFLFPTILFLLVYLLLFRLAEDGTRASKLNAIVGALFVVLGYDIIDYRTAVPFLLGKMQLTPFLIWTRTVNPVTGAILIFSLLLLLWSLIQKPRRYSFVMPGIVFGLMIGYFFSWSISFAIIGSLTLIFIFQKKYDVVKQLLLILPVWAVVSAPYWYNAVRAIGSPAGEKTALRNALFLTHVPVINKVLVATITVFLGFFIYTYIKKRKAQEKMEFWWWFLFALLLSGVTVFSQQIITGRTIWPHHYVQYTIPFSIVVGMIVLYKVVRPQFFKVWASIISIIAITSLYYGIVAAQSYRFLVNDIRDNQRYASVLAWLNDNAEKDCVVLVKEEIQEKLTRLIPSFTSCNVYSAQWILFGVVPDDERIHHTVMVHLRLQGIPAERAEQYLTTHAGWLRNYFYRDWHDFLVQDENILWLVDVRKKIVEDYRAFLKKDFSTELEKYKLDYIIADGQLDTSAHRSLSLLKNVEIVDDFHIYQ
ncbi:MAG: hypothetical protein Q8R26_02130 [bacterium]|nr:hypothetical protein [bacterium]